MNKGRVIYWITFIVVIVLLFFVIPIISCGKIEMINGAPQETQKVYITIYNYFFKGGCPA